MNDFDALFSFTQRIADFSTIFSICSENPFKKLFTMASSQRKVGRPWTYDHSSGGPLDFDRTMYQNLMQNYHSHELIQKFEIPVRTGKAWTVKQGEICRIVTLTGPQVGDLNIWNLHNPRERMWAARTRQLQRSHISTFDRIWSNLPYLRPIVTILGDTLKEYGTDEDGGRVHDFLGTRCDPYVNRLLTGEDFDHCCHSNLVRAVMPYKLTEFDVHDVLNVFQITGLNQDDRYFMKSSPAKEGDYFEFFAEIDLLCALSTCPGGDLSIPLWGEGSDGDTSKVCRPLGIEVYKPREEFLNDWTPPEVAKYEGMHGIKLPDA